MVEMIIREYPNLNNLLIHTCGRDEFRWEILKRNGKMIRFIQQPTDEMKLLSLTKSLDTFNPLEETSEEIILFRERMTHIFFPNTSSLEKITYRKLRYLTKDQLFSTQNPYHTLNDLFLRRN